MAHRIFLLFFLSAFLISSKAQNCHEINSDSLLEKHLKTIKELTEKKLYNPDFFIAGRLYYLKGTSDNNPYFQDNLWKEGSINFEGEQYPVSIMKYDVEEDVIVILKTIGTLGYPISLDRMRIKEFCIGDHCFTFLDSIKTPGYYELIYNKKTSVWARWEKEEVNSKGGNPKYKLIQRFIISKDDQYYEVKKLNEFYYIFSEKEQDLKHYKKSNKLSFIRDKSGTIVELTEQYDILTN
jgi:hypothetical protein